MSTLINSSSQVNSSKPKFTYPDDLSKRVKVANWIDGMLGVKPKVRTWYVPDDVDPSKQKIKGYSSDNHTQAARYRQCGDVAKGHVGVCENGHKQFFAYGCMLRNCPRCAARRSRELSEKLTPALLRKVSESSGRYSVKHIILGTDISLLDYMKIKMIGGEPSIVSSKLAELSSLIKMLRGAVADMLKDHFLEEGLEGCGFAIGVEFGANLILHFHVLALMPFWSQKLIGGVGGKWWEYSMHRGSYCWISELGRGDDDIKKGLGYVTKYVTKPLAGKTERRADTPNAARVDEFMARWGVECVEAALWFVFRGVRRFQTYGSFYRLEFDPDVPFCCPECEGAMTWRPATQADVDLLNSLKTNKSFSDGEKVTPLWVQKSFFGGGGGVDFWK